VVSRVCGEEDDDDDVTTFGWLNFQCLDSNMFHVLVD